MFGILLICTHIICIAAEVYNKPFHYTPHVKPQHIWHSYTFNSGTGNREELQFEKVGFDKHFASTHDVFMWRSLKVEEQIVVVGLGSNFLQITNIVNENETYSYKEDLPNSPRSMCLFEKWNAKAQEIRYFAVVAVEMTKNKFALKWYQINKGKLEFLWDWPFHRTVTHLDIVKLNFESKLLVVSYQNATNKKPWADIYSFQVNSMLDIWLFEKIILDDVPSSVSIFGNNGDILFGASFPSLETIHIFKYSTPLCFQTSEQKHFSFHQKIHSVGLKSAISFRDGSQWYLAVASKHSTIYYLKEENVFYPLDGTDLGSQNYWLAIPIDTYRQDVMLLSDSSSDVSIISWREEKLQVVGSFIQFVCGEDIECLEKMNRISLKKSTSFNYDGQQNVILSTENGYPLLFKLVVSLKPLPDKIMLTLNNIVKAKTFLEDKYNSQREQISNLDKIIKDSSEDDDSDEKSDAFVFLNSKTKTTLKSSAHNKNWTDLISATSQLKITLNSLYSKVKNIKGNNTTPSVSLDQEEVSQRVLPKNVSEGITFYGKVLINDLNLITVNKLNFSNLWQDSFRKDKKLKIKGRKNLKNLSVENVLFEKIGETLSSDLIFSDNLCEEGGQNIINGDIIWESGLYVLNNFQLSSYKQRNLSSARIISRPYRYFDNLNFEELEIKNETYIQRTVNGQPFILPVHHGHLNIHYLDIVNQAQVETVNVEENLKVGFVNGINMTSLLQKIILNNEPSINSIRVDGVFSTSDLELKQFNSIDLKVKDEKFQPRTENFSKLSVNKRDNSKNLKSKNFKTKIHVYQNLEVDGVIFSQKVNNVSWKTIQDTVRKSEENIDINGRKTFKESLKVAKMKVKGVLNGKIIENIMTTRNDQSIDVNQNFGEVQLENLWLNGSWDGVVFESFGNSLVRLSSSKSYSSNLTFQGDCLLFCERLNVSQSINNFSVVEQSTQLLPNQSHGTLKSIVASKLILHGSLSTSNNLNNISLRDFANRRVTINSPQTVEGNYSRKSLSFNGNLNLRTLNNNDISSIIKSGGDTKLINKFLDGKIQKVKKLLVKGNVTTRYNVNGYNLPQVFEKGFNIKEYSNLKGNVTFENLIYFNNINITNSIDGFSLKTLEKDIVLKHNHVFLNGVKHFSTIKVAKDMRARSLNGHLIQDIVTLKGDESMKGPVEVKGNVIVKGNVTSYGRIHQVSVNDLLRIFSTNDNAYIVPSDLKLTNDQISIDYLDVKGNIQNKPFQTFLSEAISKTNDFSAKGTKSFKEGVKMSKNVFINGTINETNFGKLLADIVYINKPQNFEGALGIHELALKELEILNSFNSKLINNLDIKDWFEDSISLDEYEVVSGKKCFVSTQADNHIKVDFINGRWPSATISLKQKQHIPVLGVFPKIKLLSDLTVSGLVNEMYLDKEFEDSVLVLGNQTIHSKTTLSKMFIINGSLAIDTIKGRKISNMITLDSEQIISTPMEIQGSVVARKQVRDLNLINNIDLKQWNEKSVLLNEQQVLNGLWVVHGSIKTKNVDGQALLDTMDLPNVSKIIRMNRNKTITRQNERDIELRGQCTKLKKLSEQYTHLPYLLSQFQMSSEYEFSSFIDSVINFKINGGNYMIVSFINDCLSSLYEWNTNNSKFTYLRKINIGVVNKWSVTYYNNSTYLITTSFKSSIKCEENLMQGNVWVFERSPERYVHLLTTNPFTDMVLENTTTNVFYTLEEKGLLTQWTIKSKRNINAMVVANVGQGYYKFIDFSITGGLAITNGREIRQIKTSEQDVFQHSLSVSNANLVPLPLNGKTLVALITKDEIVVYEDILNEKVFAVIHTYKAGSVLWFNQGAHKQAFLIVSSHHKLIEVFQYKSVSGLVKKTSIPMFSTKLQSVDLPLKNKFQPNKFVVVVQKKKIILLKTEMVGDYFQGGHTLC